MHGEDDDVIFWSPSLKLAGRNPAVVSSRKSQTAASDRLAGAWWIRDDPQDLPLQPITIRRRRNDTEVRFGVLVFDCYRAGCRYLYGAHKAQRDWFWLFVLARFWNTGIGFSASDGR